MIWRIAVASVLVFAAAEKHSGYQDPPGNPRDAGR
jgi:hypothetical protein